MHKEFALRLVGPLHFSILDEVHANIDLTEPHVAHALATIILSGKGITLPHIVPHAMQLMRKPLDQLALECGEEFLARAINLLHDLHFTFTQLARAVEIGLLH